MGSIRWRCLRGVVGVALGAAVLLAGPVARANDMDPVLSRMWRFDSSTNRIVTRNDLFDALALEYAMALSPNVNHPAETLGWSGFFIGLEATLTSIDPDALHFLCGVENERGQGGNMQCNGWSAVADGATFVPAVHVRKGLPYSLELGFQIQYMSNSELVAIGGEIRWSPFEGYREGWMGYLPDVGLAFSGNYLMGSNELALGQVGANFSISYPFTITGQATITPYFGYQFYIVGADHEQVYNSEYIDSPSDFASRFQCAGSDGTLGTCNPFLEFHGGESRNFGQSRATLRYHRLYLGARVLWENLAFTPQFAIAMPWFAGEATGETVDGVQMAEVGPRFQFSLSVGSDF
jgi:hypothetical protein